MLQCGNECCVFICNNLSHSMAGLQCKSYRYFDQNTNLFDFQGAQEDFKVTETFVWCLTYMLIGALGCAVPQQFIWCEPEQAPY